MKSLAQFIRFSLSGASSTVLHILVASLCIEIAGLKSVGANLIAYVIATTFSYIANTRWSFSSHHTSIRLVRFLSVSVVGAVLTMLIAELAERHGYTPYQSIALIVISIPPFSFVAHKYWTYRT